MNKRRGLFRLVLKKQHLHHSTQVVLIFGIILSLTVICLVHRFLRTSQWKKLTYGYNIPQTTAKTSFSNALRQHKVSSHHKKFTVNNDEEFAEVDDTCPVFRLNPNETTSDTVTCKRAAFVPGSCQLMKTLFRANPANCSHQTTHIICELKSFNPKNPQVVCYSDICNTSISIALYHVEVGNYIKYKMNSTEELASFINHELLQDFRNHYPNNGYCVIQCLNKSEQMLSQLLILPPVLKVHNKHLGQSQKSLVNINILLLDSVSRHHFYRTLPKTIHTFKELNKHSLQHGRIFDFELVQAIKGRTFESLQALFGGDEMESPVFDAWGLPPHPINLSETLGSFKAHGYEILYMEDMCWMGEWGLVKEQRAMNLTAPFKERVKLFNKAILKTGVDRLDVSYSSCLIVQENKVTDVFHGPGSICYNGIHQHNYFLQYIEYFLGRFSSLQKPTFTFIMLDTGHEDTGIRVKQLDETLSRHVSFLASQSDTISFILSDHGNNYGNFVSSSPESQVEIYHPFLFLIIPDQASKFIGRKRMKSLHMNQKRLVSLIDVHYTLKGLLQEEQVNEKLTKSRINKDGLLSPVSPYRTCKDIPRLHPNLCICQASYTTERNNSYYALFAEFALGSMNRHIAEHQTGQRRCLKLIATRFDNVKNTQEDLDNSIILLDLYVKHTGMSGNKEEMFTVTIFYSVANQMEGMLFLGYSRMTPYSVYRKCASSDVDLRLCICDTGQNLPNKSTNINGDDSVTDSVLWTKTYRSVIDKPCLYLLTRNYTAGVVLSVCNVCWDTHYTIHFHFLTRNLHSSNQMPVSKVIGPGVEEMLVVGIRKLENQHWNYKYVLKFKAFKLKRV
ncbi:hypothetical protein XELAEV_18012005mg [Xenopus laevis]|uniref:Uncharacterized protein n=1 Tax=Xenopus laevis TaxID=8355 RepID=A0A974HXR4_XENLA|nr:hypothetical protein XELAEV_18012005mg [Xenopus laevis]